MYELFTLTVGKVFSKVKITINFHTNIVIIKSIKEVSSSNPR